MQTNVQTQNRATGAHPVNLNDRVIYRGIAGEISAEARVRGITRTANPLLDLEFTNGESARRIPLASIELAEQVPA